MQTRLFNTYDHDTERSLPKPGDEIFWRDRRFTVLSVTDEAFRFVMACISHETGMGAVILSTDDYIHFSR